MEVEQVASGDVAPVQPKGRRNGPPRHQRVRGQNHQARKVEKARDKFEQMRLNERQHQRDKTFFPNGPPDQAIEITRPLFVALTLFSQKERY